MSMTELVEQLGAKLKQQNLFVTTAESCTGGMIAEVITAVPGSSLWFDRAYISYSYESKRQMLGVKENTLRNFGAVSQECAEEMALGALQFSHSNISVSCSGIAGPGGGSEEKPVGTVWISWAKQGAGNIESKLFHFDGDRHSVREQTTRAALEGLLAIVD